MGSQIPSFDHDPRIFIYSELKNGGGERQTGKSGVCAHLYVRAPSLLDQPVRTKEDGIRKSGALIGREIGGI